MIALLYKLRSKRCLKCNAIVQIQESRCHLCGCKRFQ